MPTPRFRLACFPSSEDCWWLCHSRSSRIRWTWTRRETAAALFPWWRLPQAWLAARRCGAYSRELWVRWV